jgi:hypothetical protein
VGWVWVWVFFCVWVYVQMYSLCEIECFYAQQAHAEEAHCVYRHGRASGSAATCNGHD